jgi:hypothetical protein
VRRSLLVLALAAAAGSFATSANAARPRLSLPDPLQIGDGLALQIPGTTPTVNRTLAATGTWGGPIVASDGETVNVLVSTTYPVDVAFQQQWANFLASLVHGQELAKVTLQLAPLNEVQIGCGSRLALACYSPTSQLILAPGEDVDPDTTSESIVAHEYGHHVANNSNNWPWPAVDYGTKRWASYMEVCKATEHSQMYPGSEDNNYTLNPGEGFAESFRVLNETRLGLPVSLWNVVSDIFKPNATALADIQTDISTPWTNVTTSVIKGSFTKTGTSKTTVLGTPLDGDATFTLRTPRSLKAKVSLLAKNKVVASATVSGAAKIARTTICGTRSYALRVTRLTGSGSYSVTVGKP